MNHSGLARALALAAAASLAACNWGVRPENFPPARSASGAIVAVRVTGENVDRVGELLAVDSSGVTILSTTLAHVSWRRLRAMDVEQLDDRYDVVRGERLRAGKRARLALVSRFPQGLSDALLGRALAQLGQAALERVE